MQKNGWLPQIKIKVDDIISYKHWNNDFLFCEITTISGTYILHESNKDVFNLIREQNRLKEEYESKTR